jgi:hypothetical protein
LYLLQGTLYPQGVINRILQAVLLLWGLVVSIKYLSSTPQKPKLIKATVWLLVMYAVYGSIHMLFGEQVYITEVDIVPVRKYEYLQSSLNSLLPILVFTEYSKRGYLTKSRIQAYFFIFAFISVERYFSNYNSLIQETGQQEITNNFGYSFVSLFPFVFFFNKKPLVQYLFVAILMFFIVMSMKRGAIVVGAVAFAYFLYSRMKNSYSLKNRIFTLFLSVALVVVAIVFVRDLLDNSDYFYSRVEQTEEGNMSGRNYIYTTLFNSLINEPSIAKIVFGRGADSTIPVAGNYAHNDWLETVYNNGLIGIVILLSFYIAFYNLARRYRRISAPEMYSAFFILFIICFLPTLFSMSIQDMDPSTTMLLGYFIYNSYSEPIL